MGKRVIAGYTHTVERGKIREFVLALGDPNPLYTDPEAARARGYRDLIAPPTFGIVIDLWSGYDFWAQTRELGMDPFLVLHGEQEYLYFGPIHPGDTITACQRLAADETKRGRTGAMRLVRVETVYTNQRGERVLVGRSTRIQREQGDGSAAAGGDSKGVEPAKGGRPEDSRPMSVCSQEGAKLSSSWQKACQPSLVMAKVLVTYRSWPWSSVARKVAVKVSWARSMPT